MSNVKSMQQGFKQEATKICTDLRGLADEIRLNGVAPIWRTDLTA